MSLNKRIWTRKDYMDKKCTHHDYYMGLWSALRIPLPPTITHHQLVQACERGDVHLNSIPLSKWDGAVIPFLRLAHVHKAFHERGDWVSLSGLVCVLKARAVQDVIDSGFRAHPLEWYESDIKNNLKRLSNQ